MNYDFKNKSIKCDTWEQMKHLAKLAEEQGYNPLEPFTVRFFNTGNVFFTVYDKEYMCLDVVCDPIEVSYTDFINPQIPTETIEVTGCVDCPFKTTLPLMTDWCSHPNHENKKGYVIFDTCPLKKSSITIKLKQNDTTGN